MVDALREIEQLVEFDGRWPGTDAERRAAVHLTERLRGLRRDADLEPTQVRPWYPIAHLIHALLGIAGSVISVYSHLAGLILVFVATLSAFGDLTGTFFLARLFTPRRASQNVVSREDGGKPGLLVLTAHYDAARTGLLFQRRVLERWAAFSKLVRRPLGRFGLFFWSLVVVLICCLLRLPGLSGVVLTAVQFVATVVLIVSVPLFTDIALSDVVPGANDNASGVATVLRLAERYGGSLKHFDVMVLFPGAEEGFMLGMRAWVRRHRKELNNASTVFLNIDTVGYGTVRFEERSGFILPLAFHPTLVELSRELAEGDEHQARGVTARVASDGYPARAAGFPAISLRCAGVLDYVPTYHQESDTPEHIDPDALDRAFFFSCDLIELIDARIGPDLRRGEKETVLSED